MTDYKEQQRISRRGIIVKHLSGVKGRTANADVLLTVVNGRGIPSYYNEVTADLSWLEGKGLVAISGDSDVMIAELTKRGVRLAREDMIDPGVKLPDPEA